MRAINIDLGGHHLTGDDILYVQEALKEAVLAIAGLTEQTFIKIQGVEISFPGANIQWTAGWVMMNGELLKVDAGIAAAAGNNTFQIVETNDPAGQQTYEDLNTVETYKVRKATILGNA